MTIQYYMDEELIPWKKTQQISQNVLVIKLLPQCNT